MAITALFLYLAAFPAIEAPTLNDARVSLREGRGRIGPLSIEGVHLNWEVTVGTRRVLVFAANLEGGIVVFDDNERAVAFKKITEPISVQVVDLDFDNKPEIITDEIAGRGTGIMHRIYHIYRLDPDGRVSDLWCGDSVFYSPSEQPRWGYLRFDVAQSKSPGYAVEYLILDEQSGKTTTQTLQVVDGVIRTLSRTVRPLK